jgi:hypothetical protein
MKTIKKIPKNLYRGDADRSGIRMLKETIHFGQLQTNLINGGEGRIIVEKHLQELIHQHVGIGWYKTHFLSFSSSITTALGYGASVPGDKTLNNEFEYDEYYDNDSAYDFILLTLNTDKVEWGEIGSGIYEGLYNPSLLKFSLLQKPYRVILIDVEEVLRISANNDYKDSIANAVRDKEWLLLPATTVLLNSDKQEYSAILDAACIGYKKIAIRKEYESR